MPVKEEYLENSRQAIEDMYNKEGVYKTGEFLPELKSSSAEYLQAQRFLSIVPNTLNKIVGVRYKGIFKRPITRNIQVNQDIYLEMYNALNESIDAAGQSRDDFMAEASEKASMLDFQFTMMDFFAKEDVQSFNPQELINNREFPYFKNISATQCNWDYFDIDKYGRLSRFGYDFDIVENDETVTYTKVVDAENYYIYLDDGLIETVAHELEEIPVFILKNNKNIRNSKLEANNPSLYNAFKVVLNTATLKAFSDASELVNCVKTLMYPATKQQMEKLNNKNEQLVINTGATIFFDGEFGNSPAFGSPGAGNSETILTLEKWKYENLFLEEGLNYTAGANASGKSKEVDQEQINTALGFLCNSLISLEKWMDSLFAKAVGFEIIEASYNYPKVFGIDAVKEQLSELQMLLDIGADRYKTLKEMILREALKLKFNKTEDVEMIETAINEEEETPIDELQPIE